ncbi:MAG: FHA domain-containing protein [Labilithrix sp.]|nr:FHA domain-containing protein [Labilithrix sp.]
MNLEIGIVCARCESYSQLGTATCASCGHALALEAGPAPSQENPPVSAPSTLREPPPKTPSREILPSSRPEPSPAPRAPASEGRARASEASSEPPAQSGRVGGYITPAKSSKGKSVEELMDQAKNFVCRSCSTAVPLGHKFCGRCGAAVPPEILQARTQFFGQLQAPGKAKLILIRGEGVEGLSYQLNAEQHLVGRSGQLVFPDDPFVSPKHANFFYRNGKLVVRDEGSINGVYLRVKGTLDVSAEDYFLAGEQVFRIDATPKASDQPGPDGTYFYSSPKHQSPFRITQILQGGAPGMTVCARGSTLQIGREGGDLNFPSDLYMSAAHCKLEDAGGKLMLTDLNSRNGTYIRLKAERELAHGDYVFIGRKLLRVEITAA